LVRLGERLPFPNKNVLFRLERGTKMNKRHAPVWQAWGVLETREGDPEKARYIFQQGIWACAQLGGGQSGGYKCARLWQAWGVLEAQEGDYAAARRCFSRALDADKRNIAAVTAWTLMEETLGNWSDVRVLFERALKQFTPGTEEKKRLWRAYELMEQRAENFSGAQEVYQRSLREAFVDPVDEEPDQMVASFVSKSSKNDEEKGKREMSDDDQIEVSRWDTPSMRGEVWLNNGNIESKVPKAIMKKKHRARKDSPLP